MYETTKLLRAAASAVITGAASKPGVHHGGQVMKRTHLLVLAAALLVAFLPLGPAGAAPNVAACIWDFEVSITPGLSLTPAGETYTTGGETGTIDCRGFLAEQPVTGPGRIGTRGEFLGLLGGGICPQGTGRGIHTATVPTAKGPVPVTDYYTFTFTGLAGEFRGTTMSGTFELRPLQGDCVTAPLTRVKLHVQGILRVT